MSTEPQLGVITERESTHSEFVVNQTKEMQCSLLLLLSAALLLLLANSPPAAGSSPFLINSFSPSPSRRHNNYTADWESLDSRPNPVWYDNAKFGIFIHWGVYSVPTFGSEWFWTNLMSKSPDYVKYMERNFKPGFTYQEFAKDFTAENFNASEWTELLKASGAKYLVLTSKHHDGYALWPSSYSFSWNSMDVGPHRDLVGELSAAITENSDLIFGLYHSLFEWFNPMYLADKKDGTTDFVDKKIIPEMVELVNKYKPHYIWSDGEWEASDTYWRSKDFIAWLYNSSPVKDTVLVNDRWGNETLGKHGSVYTVQDRYNPGVLQTHKWENAMTIDKGSWGYRPEAPLSEYFDTQYLIDQLVSTVSCGGNLLLNVGPSKDGRINPIFEERLRDMGRWLGVNGEAIYYTQPWIHQNDTRTQDVW